LRLEAVDEQSKNGVQRKDGGGEADQGFGFSTLFSSNRNTALALMVPLYSLFVRFDVS